MSGISPKNILIDTNIIFPLEDNKEVGKDYAELNRICSSYGIVMSVHESSIQDISRDGDENRKKISLSKIEKYPKIRRTPWDKAQREAKFGTIKNDHDEVDTDLLVSMELGVADLLVTEDRGLRDRVKGKPLESRVLTVSSALKLLRKEFGAVLVDYKHVQDRKCNEFYHDNLFFASLKKDYAGFEKWFESCIRKQRPCWVIQQDNSIAGMIIYKDELRSVQDDCEELDALGVPGNKVLKLCMFKVDETIRGEKFGEQLLKKAMDYAHRNGYDSTYLTVFPRHAELMKQIARFGFMEGKEKNGEKTFYKYSKVIKVEGTLSAFEFHQTFWPCVRKTGVAKYCIPVKPEFHARLFPEAAPQFSLALDTQTQTPGNAIRKVYICNAQTRQIVAGSILFFYLSEQSVITSIGVLESYDEAKDFKRLKELAGVRSVYSDDELEYMTQKDTSAKAMNFYYSENLKNPISLSNLKKHKVLKGAPQSITEIPEEKFSDLFSSLMDAADREIFYD